MPELQGQAEPPREGLGVHAVPDTDRRPDLGQVDGGAELLDEDELAGVRVEYDDGHTVVTPHQVPHLLPSALLVSQPHRL